MRFRWETVGMLAPSSSSPAWCQAGYLRGEKSGDLSPINLFVLDLVSLVAATCVQHSSVQQMRGIQAARQGAGCRMQQGPKQTMSMIYTEMYRESGSGRSGRGGGDRKSLLPNRLAAARARSWRRWRRGNNCPTAGPFWPWDILDRRRDPRVAAGIRRRGVASACDREVLRREPTNSTGCERAYSARCGSGRAGQARALGRAGERLVSVPEQALCRPRQARDHGP